ncbi:hypothetical protein TNCV_4870191 [Trichonephila clavipes]|nr:hypothetical protein TNCV_4870191 [Trichonephila clavipes]
MPLSFPYGCQFETKAINWWFIMERLQTAKTKKLKRVKELKENPSPAKIGKAFLDTVGETGEGNSGAPNNKTEMESKCRFRRAVALHYGERIRFWRHRGEYMLPAYIRCHHSSYSSIRAWCT